MTASVVKWGNPKEKSILLDWVRLEKEVMGKYELLAAQIPVNFAWVSDPNPTWGLKFPPYSLLRQQIPHNIHDPADPFLPMFRPEGLARTATCSLCAWLAPPRLCPLWHCRAKLP